MRKKIGIILILVILFITLSSCQETSDKKLLVPNCFESICFHTTYGNNGIFFIRDKATNNMYYYDTQDMSYRPYFNSKGVIMSYDEFIECHINKLHKEEQDK